MPLNEEKSCVSSNAPLVIKTADKKMRRHLSQENVGVFINSTKAHNTNPPKGILKQSSKTNINPLKECMKNEDPIKKELFPTNQTRGHHIGKQSLGSIAMKKVLEQAKERDLHSSNYKETDVLKNINDRIFSLIYLYS